MIKPPVDFSVYIFVSNIAPWWFLIYCFPLYFSENVTDKRTPQYLSPPSKVQLAFFHCIKFNEKIVSLSRRTTQKTVRSKWRWVNFSLRLAAIFKTAHQQRHQLFSINCIARSSRAELANMYIFLLFFSSLQANSCIWSEWVLNIWIGRLHSIIRTVESDSTYTALAGGNIFINTIKSGVRAHNPLHVALTRCVTRNFQDKKLIILDCKVCMSMPRVSQLRVYGNSAPTFCVSARVSERELRSTWPWLWRALR